MPILTLMYLFSFLDRGKFIVWSMRSNPFLICVFFREHWYVTNVAGTVHSCNTHIYAGNAKLQGLVTQLDLTGNKYNIALVCPSGFKVVQFDSWSSQTMYFVVCVPLNDSIPRELIFCASLIVCLNALRSTYLSPNRSTLTHECCSLVLKKLHPSRWVYMSTTFLPFVVDLIGCRWLPGITVRHAASHPTAIDLTSLWSADNLGYYHDSDGTC